MKMKKSGLSIITVVFITAAMVLAGCGINEELDDDFAENYEQGMSGGLTDESPNDTWPATMPGRIPVFEEGTIVSTSSLRVGGQWSIEVNIEDVMEDDLNDYMTKLQQSEFEKQTSTTSGSIANHLFVEKGNVETAISIAYAQKTGELIISFSGN